MKFILPFLLLISSCIFAQPNSDAAKMKKEGTRQIFFYSIDKSPVPNAILYYDENGFLYRELSLDWYPSDDPRYGYTVSGYDHRGRLVRSESGTYTGTDPKHLTFLPENKYSITWNYASDSLLVETDSTYKGKRIADVSRRITVTHWKKNIIPGKKRPLFLTDSFPERQKVTETVYHFYYQSEETSAEDKPVKTDSSYSRLDVTYVTDSSSMIGNYIWERHNYDTIEQYENTRIYTLHQTYDTATWSNTSWINLPTPEEKKAGLDNLHYITIQAYRIKRGIFRYSVFIYPNLYKGSHTAIGYDKPRKIKTRDPWHDDQLEIIFPEQFIPEDYSLAYFTRFYFPKKIVRVK
jgi:hypothetical protein